MKRELKYDKGITLIALVITIIVLLVLAGVTLSMISSQDGILKKAVDAKQASEIGTVKEQIQLKLVNKLGEGELTDGDLEDVFKDYGEVEYNDSGRVKGIMREDGSEILTSDVWKGKIYPNLNENDAIEYGLTVLATQDKGESNLLDSSEQTSDVNSKVDSGYEIKKLAFDNSSKYKIQKVWFTDSASVSFTVKYGGRSSENKTSGLNVEKVIQAGNLKVDLLGDIKNQDQYKIMWENKITKKVIVKNSGNFAMKYKLNLTKNETGNLSKYLKFHIEDKDGNIIDDISSIEGKLSPGEETYYNFVFSLGE